MRVLDPELVQLVRAEGRDHLAGHRIHRVEKIGGAFERVDAAAAVVRRIVVKPDPSRRREVAAAKLIVAFGDREFRRLHVRNGVGLRLQTQLRHDRRRDGERTVRREIPSRLLPPTVEEQLVPHNWTADVGGAGIDAGVGLLRGCGNRRTTGGDRRVAATEEERERAERPAAEQVSRLALEAIRPRRRDGVVHHPHGLPELGSEPRGDHLDFLDHHLRHRQQAKPGAVLLGIRVAVDLIVDAHGGAVRGQARHAEFDILISGDARLDEREVVRVAGDEWKVVHLDVAHGMADVDPCDVQRGRVGGNHRNRFADGADRQRRVHHLGLPDRQLDTRLLELLEALQFGNDPVRAEREQRCTIQAEVVRDDAPFRAGVEVRNCHGHAWQHAARRIRDVSFDGAIGCSRLRGDWRGERGPSIRCVAAELRLKDRRGLRDVGCPTRAADQVGNYRDCSATPADGGPVVIQREKDQPGEGGRREGIHGALDLERRVVRERPPHVQARDRAGDR